ncbi:hypothetical protein SAMN05216410_0458 [Sanguibacter gelidistatuariae]|uniref:Uncharacterized protein n=1 Tax=Sanguibacter gelidistatuariae TaxID=1814289 RepID=A0A1G6GTD7_9MICO|nr:hypothetical protein [Sanguibacter gelidistatuariae]SDB85204.1 hypothetical protein SAMN05216410_0458 [Sanguibacter gelidistatuariae]
MANDTDPQVRSTEVDAEPRPAPRRRKTRRWTLMLFAIEVVIVAALVWFSWSGGSWA